MRIKSQSPHKDDRFLSSNGHAVRRYGRLFFIVSSRTRDGLDHWVDLEGFDVFPYICSCEDWKFHGHRPCRHIRACMECLMEPLGIDNDKLPEAVDRAIELLEVIAV